jgi:3-dehydroquinate synthase
MACRIEVKQPAPGYALVVGPGGLAAVPGLLGDLGITGRLIVVTNTDLHGLYAAELKAVLPGADVLVVPEGEQHKSLDTVRRLYRQLVELHADRATILVAFGGGVVGDLAGFVAATYMRGIRFVQIPTSLLAMVDASIGGKVGVDLPEGKNLVGAFHQPVLVVADTALLGTLPDEEWRCGAAECIKHGLIADPLLLDFDAYHRDRAEALVCRSAQVKTSIIQRDPFEKGERVHLNLGHTFAHAIEQVSAYQWRHGDAVAVGLLAAARLSVALGACAPEVETQVSTLLAAMQMPRTIVDLEPAALWNAMATDKKWEQGEARFVLLRGIGVPFVLTGVPRQAVLDVLYSLRGDC